MTALRTVAILATVASTRVQLLEGGRLDHEHAQVLASPNQAACWKWGYVWGKTLVTRGDVIRSGRKYLGVPYVLGTPSPCGGSGMDCDCFTKCTFNDLGISLGWWTDQFNYGRRISLANRRPGDLLFFSEDGSGYLTHVGIQSRDGHLLHASNYFGKVVESELRYMTGLYAARRLI